MTRIEHDADYVWALEVLVCNYLGDRDDPPHDDVRKARNIIEETGLQRPMDRLG